MTATDQITRRVVLPASRERVWASLTTPAQLAKWFAPECEFELEVGSSIRFVWESGEVSRGVIEEIAPPRTFAFRWHAQRTEYTDPLTPRNSTLVTFTLSETGEGTQLTVIETGFSQLPDDVRAHVLQENDRGWDAELEELIAFMGVKEDA